MVDVGRGSVVVAINVILKSLCAVSVFIGSLRKTHLVFDNASTVHPGLGVTDEAAIPLDSTTICETESVMLSSESR